MTVSASTKTFENLKLENHRSDIAKTYPLCVPPEHLSFTENWGCHSKGEHIQKNHQKMPGTCQNLDFNIT